LLEGRQSRSYRLGARRQIRLVLADARTDRGSLLRKRVQTGSLNGRNIDGGFPASESGLKKALLKVLEIRGLAND
jgi:hypothetical protein